MDWYPDFHWYCPYQNTGKLANRLAKKGLSAHGAVLDWRTLDSPDELLATIALDDIWGISKRWSEKLKALGIHNALALKQTEPKRMRQHFGVVMERIVCELRGISVFR